MIQKILNKKLILFLLLGILYSIGNNILYLPAYPDLPTEINKIENCKNEKIVKKAISNSGNKNNNFKQFNTMSIKNFHHIKKFTSDGVLLNSWGVKGTGKGEFLHPHGIGSDSYGNIYVSDAIKCNIQKFDNNGNFLLEFGKRGNGPSELLQPESIAIDKNDNVFVVDYVTSHIQKFDSNGNFITMWGFKGNETNQFMKPWGIGVDSKGNVYVGDQQNPVINNLIMMEIL